jgi:hypothetical protein
VIIEAVLLVDLLLESIDSHLMQQSTMSSILSAKRIQQENRASCNKSGNGKQSKGEPLSIKSN